MLFEFVEAARGLVALVLVVNPDRRLGVSGVDPAANPLREQVIGQRGLRRGRC